MTRLDQLSALGQSVWIDFLSRELIESGALAHAIQQDAVVGVTSNPTIFGKALSQSTAYDAQIANSYGLPTTVFHALAIRDVATACDVLRPVWEQTKMSVGWAIPSPDGRYLALWQASSNANVWMVEHF